MSQTLTPIDPALRHGPEAAPVQGSTPITKRVGRPLAWAGRGAATVASRSAAVRSR